MKILYWSLLALMLTLTVPAAAVDTQYLASNPALHRNLPFFLERFSYAQETGSSKLFVSSGTLDDPRVRKPAQEWIRHWNGRIKKPWRLKTMDLENHIHMSAPPAAFRQGMHWLVSED